MELQMRGAREVGWLAALLSYLSIARSRSPDMGLGLLATVMLEMMTGGYWAFASGFRHVQAWVSSIYPLYQAWIGGVVEVLLVFSAVVKIVRSNITLDNLARQEAVWRGVGSFLLLFCALLWRRAV